MTVSDWYWQQAPYLIEYFQSPLNVDLHGGSEPVPNATLINESQNVTFQIQPNKAYLFRIINMGGFAAQYISMDQHDMTVVEIDGVYTKPHRVSQLFLSAAQRYSVIVQSKRNTNQNYAISVWMEEDMFDPGVIPSDEDDSVRAEQYPYSVLLLTMHSLVLGSYMIKQNHFLSQLRVQKYMTTRAKMTQSLFPWTGKRLIVPSTCSKSFLPILIRLPLTPYKESLSPSTSVPTA
jgi:FtsP/CotA-like multicopper oxidase with cupredoxin domain